MGGGIIIIIIIRIRRGGIIMGMGIIDKRLSHQVVSPAGKFIL